jgi:dUTP pyrophosphatase
MEDPVVFCAGAASRLPTYQSAGAAGADLHALIPEDIVVAPGARVLVPTGLYLEIPSGLEGQVRPRSGLAAKDGITVLNSPGTIDSDYRGELKVILVNLGEAEFRIKNGDRIAQIVFSPVVRVSFQKRDAVEGTQRQNLTEYRERQNLTEYRERGSGGFGSTGVR